jgi:predicted phosphate transport protein (TIGR00153 family)
LHRSVFIFPQSTTTLSPEDKEAGDNMFKFSLMPRDDRFFDLFEVSAQNMVRAAECLKELVCNWENLENKCDELIKIEHQGDTITHEIMYQLNRSFITPFDREDITMLAHTLDDVTDLIQAAGDTMLLYKVKAPGQRTREMAGILVQTTSEVKRVMPSLRKHNANVEQILSSCVEINRLENLADTVYRSSLSELFEDNTDIAEIIKWREIYEHMEGAMDMCEDVANVIDGVTLKYA